MYIHINITVMMCTCYKYSRCIVYVSMLYACCVPAVLT